MHGKISLTATYSRQSESGSFSSNTMTIFPIDQTKCMKLVRVAIVAFVGRNSAMQIIDLIEEFRMAGAPEQRHSHFHA
jgi:hypothetical protein